TQPIHQQQQFGGSAGGPIMKDRLFFFFTYDGFRRVGRVLYSNTNTISLTPAGTASSTNIITPTQCPVPGTLGYTPTTGITPAHCISAITFLQQVSNVAAGSVPPSRFAKQNLFF